MKAVIQDQFGGADTLYIGESTTPVPKANEILVRVHATSVNRADLLQREGKYPPPPGTTPILGLDIAGEVVALGAEVEKWRTGDRVFGLVSGGAYAEYCGIDSELAMPIPSELTYEEAAAIPEAFLTAYGSLFLEASLKPKEKLLIHAASSGVGTAALQLAKAIKCKVWVTAGTNEKRQRLCQMGAESAYDYQDKNLVKNILESTDGKGVDVIQDFTGAELFSKNLEMLALKGRMVILATMKGHIAELPLMMLISKRLTLKGFRLRFQTLEEKRMLTHIFQHQWLNKFQTKELKPIINRVFPIENVREAHEYMEQRYHFGKIILKMNF